jgi:hypothetical protein
MRDSARELREGRVDADSFTVVGAARSGDAIASCSFAGFSGLLFKRARSDGPTSSGDATDGLE